jgi:5-hydroxyisourate hydrolase-like protein (transthyretin family)
VLVVGIGIAVLVGCGVLLWWARAPAPRPAAAARREAARDARPGALAAAPAPASPGTFTIRGEVRGPGGRIAGVVVTATATAGDGERLSERRCHCGDCGQRLLACGCAEAAAQLVELVAERRSERRPAARATTGEDGRFVLEGLADGAYGIWAEADAGAALVQGVRAGAEAVVVDLEPGVRIAGRVTTDGRGVAQAVVTAIQGAHGRLFDAVTAADGAFSVGPLPAGDYTVVASASGLLPARARVERGEPGRVRLELEAPRVLAGRVTLDGAPAEGAAVTLEGQHRKGTVRAGADGAFEFGALHAGEYHVVAALQQRVASASVEVSRRRDARDVALALGAGVDVDGVVVDDAGAPVEGARVTLDRLAPRRRAGIASARTDAAGRFRVGPVEPGQLEVSATRDGYLADGDERTRVVAVERATARVVLRRASRIEGTIVDPDGEGVAGAYVVATPQGRGPHERGSRSVVSGEDGAFALDLRGGGHALDVEHDAFRRVKVPVEAPARGVRVVLPRGAAVEGEVLDEEGRPAAGAEVALGPAGDDAPERLAHRSARADAHGRFRLAGLDGGSALVVARRSAEEGGGVAGARVEVPAEGTARAVLRFEAGLTLSGSVVTTDGAPVPDASVTALVDRRDARRDDPAVRLLADAPAEAVTDPAGRFTLRGLRPGGYLVSAAKDGYVGPDRLRRAAAGDRDVRVVLGRQGRVRLRVVGDGGAPVAGALVNGRASPERDGRFALPVGSEPSLALVVVADGYAPLRRAVEVTRGEDVDLGDVALSRGRALSGVVVDGGTGAPVAGARVVVSAGSQPASPLADERAAQVMVTAPDGRFAAPHAPDPAQLRVDADGYAPATVPVAGGHGAVRVPLGRGGSVAVRVLRVSGEPMAHVDVMAFNREGMHRSGRTGDDGRWEAAALTPGRYVVFVGADRSNPGLAGTAVEVADGARAAVELREVAAGATLAVTLTGPGARDGEELHAALVRGDLPPGASLADPSALGVPIEPVGNGAALSPVFRLLSPGRYTLLVARPDGAGGFGLLTRAVDVGAAPEQTLEVQVPEELPTVRW